MKPLLLVAVLIICISSLYPQVNLDSGLVAYYPFTGNANDASGNNNHGVVMGAELVPDRFDNDSAAYEFDGTSSYISVANSATLASPSTQLSQVAWINIYSWSTVGSPFGPILMKSNSGANAFQYRLSVGSSGITTSINNWLNTITISDTLNFLEWYMIVSTLQDDTVKSYVNGVFIGEDVLTGPINPDDLPLEIGRDVPGLTEVFNGKIDDIRIYNRALTAAEIQELYEITTYLDTTNPQNFRRFQLAQNYPNPFNPNTTIEFTLPRAAFVTIKIYNTLGAEVITVVSEKYLAGTFKYKWNASDLASGLYYYRVSFDEHSKIKKALLLK